MIVGSVREELLAWKSLKGRYLFIEMLPLISCGQFAKKEIEKLLLTLIVLRILMY